MKKKKVRLKYLMQKTWSSRFLGWFQVVLFQKFCQIQTKKLLRFGFDRWDCVFYFFSIFFYTFFHNHVFIIISFGDHYLPLCDWPGRLPGQNVLSVNQIICLTGKKEFTWNRDVFIRTMPAPARPVHYTAATPEISIIASTKRRIITVALIATNLSYSNMALPLVEISDFKSQ